MFMVPSMLEARKIRKSNCLGGKSWRLFVSNRVAHSREFEADRGECGSKTLIGSTIVAMAAAIVTIANVVIAVVVEPQQSWS